MHRLFRQLVASGTSTIADTATLLVLVHVLPAGIAAAIGCFVGGAINFTISRAFVFRSAGTWWRQAARYAVIVVGGGAVVSGLAVAALVAAHLPLLVAKAIAIVTTLLAWTYPMSARVVFAHKPSHPGTPSHLSAPSTANATTRSAIAITAP